MTKPASREVTLTRAQLKLSDEFCKDYGLTPDQIGFSSRSSTDPIFDFDALNVLANTLADIPEIDVQLNSINEIRGMANSVCRIELSGGRDPFTASRL